MAKFEKKYPEKGRSGRQGREGSEKKKDDYKSKRSFTKNKDLREKQKASGSGRGEGRFFKERRGDSDRPFNRERFGGSDNKKPERKFRDDGPKREGRTGGSRENPRFSERRNNSDRSRGERDERSGSREGRSGSDRDNKRSFEKRSDGERFNKRDERPERREKREGGDRTGNGFSGKRDERKRYGSDRDERPRSPRTGGDSRSKEGFDDKPQRRVKYNDFEEGRSFSKREERSGKKPAPQKKNDDGLVRLNKYLSNAGVASRREADILIQSGTVKVNGVVIDQLGYKIKPTDVVTYGDSAVKSERKVYLLLNKPKDYITTVDDPRERKTVMELVAGACRERIYPVGRLDRNTTGLLLFTNDGELTTKLTHPKHGVKKVYHVTLNKGLRADDFRKIVDGFDLEDGPVKVDDLAFVGEGKKEIGIEIHSGRNRIVRRIFEHLGYDVIKLDRVVFAGLTKKDLPRGKHRFLTAKEVSFLQMIG